MRLIELLGLMDADEKVQLIYPEGEKLTGTTGTGRSWWSSSFRGTGLGLTTTACPFDGGTP